MIDFEGATDIFRVIQWRWAIAVRNDIDILGWEYLQCSFEGRSYDFGGFVAWDYQCSTAAFFDMTFLLAGLDRLRIWLVRNKQCPASITINVSIGNP